MSNELPFVSYLCPTYRRPKLLENSIACFLAQDYPADRRELIVLDDAGELQNQTGEGWQIISIPRRFRSLPEKFNALGGLARGEILAVWEDDDIYLPHHISSHVTAMDGHLWSKPSKVLSDYTGEIREEDATGRFHASLAFTRQVFEQVAGWPLTLRGDYDQQLISRLNSIGPAADPCMKANPSSAGDPPGHITARHSCRGRKMNNGTGGWHDNLRQKSPLFKGSKPRLTHIATSIFPFT